MHILFLINGPEQHGITRAGRFMALSAQACPGAEVSIRTTPDAVPGHDLATEIKALAPDAVVLVGSSLTDRLWGARETRGATIAGFAVALGRPIILYVHDVYGETRVRILRQGLRNSIRDLSRGRLPGFRAVYRAWRMQLEARFFQDVGTRIAGFIVSNPIERRNLLRHLPRARVEVVHHFIEARTHLLPQSEAKAALGFSGKTVITLLGYMNARKGYETAVEVLAMLPRDTVLVFAGSVPDSAQLYFESVNRRIAELGLSDRVVSTGYLEDAELDLYLSATDVALCPFRRVSESGSFATWIASGTPLVVSDLELFRFYKEKFPSLVRLAPVGNSPAFAAEIRETLAESEVKGSQISESANKFDTAHSGLAMLAAIDRLSRAAVGSRLSFPRD